MFRNILRHKLISSIFLPSFLLVLGGTLWAYFALRGIGQPLILHFNDLAGITQIGSALSFLGVGTLGILGVGVNFILALELEARDRFFAKLLAAATLFMSALLFISFAAIIGVN